MIYKTEGQAISRIWHLAQTLGVWPGYYWNGLAGKKAGWVLTYDPHSDSPADYKGRVLL